MSKVVYTLKEHSRTDEYHLFESVSNPEGTCSASSKSMCKAMEWVKGNKFACQNEKETFLKCAKLGRQVCGNCMKELYGTHD